jgi:hypothetical protein
MKSILALSLVVALAAAPTVRAGAAPQSGSQTPPAPAKPSEPDAKTAPPSVAGKWTMALDMSMGQSTPALDLKQDGEKLTGTYTGRYGTFALEGTIKGRAVQFFVTISVDSQQVDMAFAGELAADGLTMKGTADLGPAGDGTWQAKKDKS